MIKPNILFPNFEKIVGFVSLTSSKSIKPFFPKSTCFSIIPNGFIIRDPLNGPCANIEQFCTIMSSQFERSEKSIHMNKWRYLTIK